MAQKSNSLVADISYKSELNTINNILIELVSIAKKMQQYIVKQNWEKVFELTDAQKDVNYFFDKAIKDLNINNKQNKNDSDEISKLKNELKVKIIKYKELEFINAKLLDDSLYAAKQKINKMFNNVENKTYTKNVKKESNLWNNNPVVLDSFA